MKSEKNPVGKKKLVFERGISPSCLEELEKTI